MRAGRRDQVHVFPYSPRPGTTTPAEDTCAAACEEEAKRQAARALGRRLPRPVAEKVGRADVVLVDRPGRGYGADYSPWLVDGSVGELVLVHGRAVTRRGSSLPDDCLFCKLDREATRREGRRLRRDPGHQPQAETHLLMPPGAPRRDVPRRRRVPADEAKRMLDFVAEVARGAGSRTTACSSTSVAAAARRSSTYIGTFWVEDPRDALNETPCLIAEIKEQLEAAMRDGDNARRDTLRLILASLQGAEKELQRPLHEDEELQVLQRERKKRVEAAEAFRTGGREEQAELEEDELDVLEEFMPEPISEDELESIVDDVIAEVGATSMRDIGRVMADVMPQVAGRADGSAVSQLVREKLA